MGTIIPPFTFPLHCSSTHNYINMYKIAVVVLLACVAINAAPQYLIGAPYAGYGYAGHLGYAGLPYAAHPAPAAYAHPAPVAYAHPGHTSHVSAAVRVVEHAPKVEVVAEPVEQHGYVIPY